LFYDIQDDLSVGIRGEWFRDNAGFRVFTPGRVAAGTNETSNYTASFASQSAPASYYAVTAGATWKPLKWLNVRPNVRYDWADGHNTSDGSRYNPFGNFNKQSQFLFSTDVVILF
jgi:hypothetical protein